jgi:serine/threonine protein kinase
MILGTAAYMSPEQAKGKSVDKRADIWAFGVVLYELLTDERLFQGETVSDTLAAVLTKEPEGERVPVKVRRPLMPGERSAKASARHERRRAAARRDAAGRGTPECGGPSQRRLRSAYSEYPGSCGVPRGRWIAP